MVNGPGPGGRYYHTMTLAGFKLFAFGDMSLKSSLSKVESILGVIWARTRKQEAPSEGRSSFSINHQPYHNVRIPLTLAFSPHYNVL